MNGGADIPERPRPKPRMSRIKRNPELSNARQSLYQNASEDFQWDVQEQAVSPASQQIQEEVVNKRVIRSSHRYNTDNIDFGVRYSTPQAVKKVITIQTDTADKSKDEPFLSEVTKTEMRTTITSFNGKETSNESSFNKDFFIDPQ